jgi:hypothetical protein
MRRAEARGFDVSDSVGASPVAASRLDRLAGEARAAAAAARLLPQALQRRAQGWLARAALPAWCSQSREGTRIDTRRSARRHLRHCVRMRPKVESAAQSSATTPSPSSSRRSTYSRTPQPSSSTRVHSSTSGPPAASQPPQRNCFWPRCGRLQRRSRSLPPGPRGRVVHCASLASCAHTGRRESRCTAPRTAPTRPPRRPSTRGRCRQTSVSSRRTAVGQRS